MTSRVSPPAGVARKSTAASCPMTAIVTISPPGFAEHAADEVIGDRGAAHDGLTAGPVVQPAVGA